MEISLRNKKALVTGGANGLGRMIAEGLLQAGANVLITARRNLDAALAEMSHLGYCEGIEIDLAADGAIDRLNEEVSSRTNDLHILVNNAGTTWGAPFDSYPDKAWSKVLDVNLRVPFAIVQRLAGLLENSGAPSDPARVINIGSIAGLSAMGLHAYSYSASKAALHHMSRELAAELGARNIAINTVVPGFFPTNMTAHIRSDEAEAEAFTGRIPLGRFGEAGDIASLCVFLSSRHSAYITGAQIVLDGGISATR